MSMTEEYPYDGWEYDFDDELANDEYDEDEDMDDDGDWEDLWPNEDDDEIF